MTAGRPSAPANDFSHYVAAHRERRQLEERARPMRAEHARQQARDAAERIARRTGATRVWLFGSLARGTFGTRSDIDLAVEGLAPGQLVDAIAVAEAGCDRAVDVVPIDRMSVAMAEEVRSGGVVLWPR